MYIQFYSSQYALTFTSVVSPISSASGWVVEALLRKFSVSMKLISNKISALAKAYHSLVHNRSAIVNIPVSTGWLSLNVEKTSSVNKSFLPAIFLLALKSTVTHLKSNSFVYITANTKHLYNICTMLDQRRRPIYSYVWRKQMFFDRYIVNFYWYILKL